MTLYERNLRATLANYLGGLCSLAQLWAWWVPATCEIPCWHEAAPFVAAVNAAATAWGGRDENRLREEWGKLLEGAPVATKDAKKEDDGRSPWASNADRFPDDLLLRAHGFRIDCRRKGQVPLWRDRDGKLVNQNVALERVRAAGGSVQACKGK